MSKEIRDGKTVWWLYQARRVNTQTNVGGGSLVTRITLPSGVVAKLVGYYYQGPLTNTANAIRLHDEDGAVAGRLAGSTGATQEYSLPTLGQVANATGILRSSDGLLLGPGITIYHVCAAAAQNETMTVYIALLASAPIAATITWDTTGSAGTPSLAASTISTANTEQAVVM